MQPPKNGVLGEGKKRIKFDTARVPSNFEAITTWRIEFGKPDLEEKIGTMITCLSHCVLSIWD